MTPAQRAAIRDVLCNVQNSGLAFGYLKERKFPEYPVDMAMAEIEKILEDKP